MRARGPAKTLSPSEEKRAQAKALAAKKRATRKTAAAAQADLVPASVAPVVEEGPPVWSPPPRPLLQAPLEGLAPREPPPRLGPSEKWVCRRCAEPRTPGYQSTLTLTAPAAPGGAQTVSFPICTFCAATFGACLERGTMHTPIVVAREPRVITKVEPAALDAAEWEK